MRSFNPEACVSAPYRFDRLLSYSEGIAEPNVNFSGQVDRVLTTEIVHVRLGGTEDPRRQYHSLVREVSHVGTQAPGSVAHRGRSVRDVHTGDVQGRCAAVVRERRKIHTAS